MAPRDSDIRRICTSALERRPDERLAFVADACAGDNSLRREVESLLAQQTAAERFLETPALHVAAQQLHSVLGRNRPDTLAAGSRFGPYDVLGVIGAGGMGEVYRARDSVLHRDVALKVLPGAFALDPDRLGRFRREAQVLASLNHPNIGAIHGVEEAAHVRALVLEVVEGSTLAQRIAQGPIPLDDALPIAHQICDALEAAHAKGIVHRDLKPANIKVRPDGIVKVLDFGLAKMLEIQPGESALSRSRTMMESMPGMVLGTAAYMSPEQSKGHEVEHPTDVWAFGCVLFEMLAGRAAFEGESRTDVLAAILTTEPHWALLPANTPESIRRLLRRCLQKDLKHRLRDIGDARIELDEARSDLVSPASRVGYVRKRRMSAILSVVAIACASAAVAGAAVYFWSGPRNDRVYRSTIQATLSSDLAGNLGNAVSMSSDGRLAFIGLDSTGNNVVYVRALDGLTARPLAGTQGAKVMFWSPDSRSLGFIAGNILKTIDVNGNAPALPLHQALVALPGSWNSDGVILFSPAEGSPLFRIPSKGGTATPVTSLDTKAGEGAHVFPYFLPDGRHFLYLAQESGGFPHGVYVGSLDSTERTRLFDTGSNAQYARRTLFFMRGSTLMAQPFDTTRMALRGEAVPLADRVQVSESTLSTRAGAFSVSESGDLIYRGDASGGSELVWRDRTGREIGRLGDREKYGDVVLSPDAARALVTIVDPGTATRDVWIYDIARGLRSRFTFDPEDDLDARWFADGHRFVFASRRGGHLDLYSKSANGSDDEQRLLADDLDKYPQSLSSEGHFLLYNVLAGPTSGDLWVLPLIGADRTPFPFLNTRFSEGTGQFSPDGHWIAYRSDESGQFEIYVAPFPGPGEKRRISTARGSYPRWRRDGKEIFYVSPDNTLMAAAVSMEGGRVEVAAVRRLFQARPVAPRYFYDVSPDGQRFLVNTPDDPSSSAPITLVANWPTLLPASR